MTEQPLDRFTRQQTVLLRTRKRDGSWVGTPVNIAVEAGRGYVRTYGKSWKSKRLRNFPDVELCPSTTRGKPTGDFVPARARLLDGAEARAAARRLARKHPLLHGIVVPLAHKLTRDRTLHYELTAT
ncbi:PPOX class F420-dependent oxidoreductase [Fodinicola acaciae]|uniref:PPOX class F420-dependent oxidoreductase n=1 Tax=Fodinicola acaciae TaxID=2681555 RepID=UPI0013D6A761|nr:PPOX class F420-dependent oxidoreductase [Fodinicola acaciae]